VQISLVGQCPPNIATYIRSISNPKVLTIIENPSPDELSRYFLNSDIFVSPSFNEGFGISSIEAMSYGLIPVLSRKTGVSEILIGTLLEKLIFDSGNVGQLALCIEYLHNLNTEEFDNLSDISYQIAKNYSFDRFANEFVEFVTQEI
jgi:glycosyltransferase involved in cell wall biosynthesis